MAMDRTYLLRLNFLPLQGPIPSFRIYRKLREPAEPKPSPDLFGFSLPINNESNERNSYWVSLDEAVGFETYFVRPDDNVHLTRRAMFQSLCQIVKKSLSGEDYEIPGEGFFEELSFNFNKYAEGQDQLTVQPYLLRETNVFGWLADFHFRANLPISDWRRVQQLSLSLDRNFKRNLDCYLDRMNRINSFLQKRRPILDSVILSGTNQYLSLAAEFESLPARRLRSKTYLFSNNNEAMSQFTGLQRFGPLEPLEAPPTLLFAFRERDRQAARTLALAIQGSPHKERFNFPGFESLFKSRVIVDGNPIILNELSLNDFKLALERVKKQRQTSPGTIPIFVLPEGDENGYREHKAVFTHEGIPTQVCTLRIINDNYALKWAIANIALQVFCKAGGKPWKVRPTQERTLIIGISQSHKLVERQGRKAIDKYFAFSVMTDNSGLFQQLRVLGESEKESSYLNELNQNVGQILKEASNEFSQVVIHTSFRLKSKEISTIEQTVRNAANATTKCRFAVVKVNHRNRFFGVNPAVNSLVPFEGTTIRLGGGEHLIWFEGIFPDKQTVTKAFPGPTHVAFLRVSTEDAIADDSLLQDLVNLSGANWRGFNAKSAPVSVFYCHLVADLVHEFQEGGLPLPQVQDLRPWFL